MLKETLRDALPKISIEDLLPIHWIGQGYGYKSPIVFEDVEMADHICYISEYCYGDALADDYVFDEMDFWTRNDFVDLCEGDEVKAAMVFGMCSWESPGAILDQWDKDDEEALNNERANYNG